MTLLIKLLFDTANIHIIIHIDVKKFQKIALNKTIHLKSLKMASKTTFSCRKVCSNAEIILPLQRQNPPRLLLMRTRAGLFYL